MYLFEIVSAEPLEPQDDKKYSSIASNGTSMLFLEPSGPTIARYCPQLHFLDSHSSARLYTCICYDPVDQCYWGCTHKSSHLVYKLSSSFQEVDRFELCQYDPCLGSIKAISYDRQNDGLILTFANRVLTVDKRSFCQKAVDHCGCVHTYQACVRCCRFYFYLGLCNNRQIITVFKDGELLIHTCPPAGHRFVGMAEICGEDGPVIHFLSVKHGTYYYILRGVLVGGSLSTEDGTGTCPEPKETGKLPCEAGNHTDLPDENTSGNRCCPDEVGGSQSVFPPCKEESGKELETCGGSSSNEHGHEYCGGQYRWEDLPGSCVSIIESIALEQTAISHILNAEGEKIQKVVEVSNRPSDFLHVNRSVEKMITKVTHLEQVLFSKLELACEVLRESEERLDKNT